MNIKLTNDDKKHITHTILSSLPEWFGKPDSINQYVSESEKLDMITVEVENKIIGFATLKETSKHAIEITVMGITREYHNQGIGTKLINKIVQYVTNENYSLLQVKTVDHSHPSKEYELTRKFYQKQGFKELECIPEIWGENNPCLIYVRTL